MKTKFTVSVILSVFTVFYLFFVPSVAFQNFDTDIYSQREKNAEPIYKGIVTLWNTGAPSSVVNKFISHTEKSYTRFFIEKENISPKEAKSRISGGEYPDIIIFSKGLFAQNPPLCPLSQSADISENIADTAKENGILYALPFMAEVDFPGSESGETTAPVTLWYAAVPRKNGGFKEEFLAKAVYRILDESLQKFIWENSYIPLLNGKGLYEPENMYSLLKDEITLNVNFKNIFAPQSLYS